VLALLAVAGLAAAGLTALGYRPFRGVTRPVQAAAPAARRVAEPVRVAPAGVATVVLEIETRPSGAVVRLGGHDAGITPLRIDLARSESPVSLGLTCDGYAPLTETIVPNANQRLRLTLDRVHTHHRSHGDEAAPPEPGTTVESAPVSPTPPVAPPPPASP